MTYPVHLQSTIGTSSYSVFLCIHGSDVRSQKSIHTLLKGYSGTAYCRFSSGCVPRLCLVAWHTGHPEAGLDPRGHLWVTWGVYLWAGKPPLADILLSHSPDLT